MEKTGIVFHLKDDEAGVDIRICAECECGRSLSLSGPDMVNTLKGLGFGRNFELKCGCGEDEVFLVVERINFEEFVLYLPPGIDIKLYKKEVRSLKSKKNQ